MREGRIAPLWPALLAAAAACSSGSPSPGPGARTADDWLTEPPSPTAAASSAAGVPRPPTPPAAPWELARELPLLRLAAKRAASEHLGGAVEGEVLANEAARAYPALGPRRTLGPGATLLERHFAPGTAGVVTYFAMVKRPPGYDPQGGDWEYLVVASDGRIEDRGPLPLCARCHADAPNDHLFGPGR